MSNDSFQFLAVLGGGNNVELKVIVRTKYQTKEKYVVTNKERNLSYFYVWHICVCVQPSESSFYTQYLMLLLCLMYCD